LAALLGTLFTGAQGKFHNGMLCVAGGLYRAGYHIDEACSIVNAVCAISGQEGVDDRLKELNHTYSKGARNDPALASWGSLLQYFPDAKATVDALTFDWPEQRAPLREGADPELEAMTMGDTPGRKREEAAQALGTLLNEAGVPQEDTAPAEVLAPGLFEGHGAVGLIGREKIGKSRLIRDLIRAALTGGTFYDEYTFARPCNVLFMALENTGQELHRFFNGSGIDLDLHCTRGAGADEQREMLGVGRLDTVNADTYQRACETLGDTMPWTTFVETAIKHYRPDIVIIDTLSKIGASWATEPDNIRRVEKNIVKADYARAHVLQQCGVEHRCVIIPLMHTSKNARSTRGGGYDPFRSVNTTAGTLQALSGFMVVCDLPDVSVFDREHDTAQQIVFGVRNRWSQRGDELWLLESTEFGGFNNLGPFTATVATNAGQRMLQALWDLQEAAAAQGQAGIPIAASAIGDRIGAQVGTVRTTLGNLQRRNPNGVTFNQHVLTVTLGRNGGYNLAEVG
jgi:hypothetical protein